MSWFKPKKIALAVVFVLTVLSSVADPDPGSGAVLTLGFGIRDPGSGMGKKSRSGYGNRDEHPESYFRERKNNILS
jgi:hypothetical protein